MTPIELLANWRVHRRYPDTREIPLYYDLQPIWVRVVSIFVDLSFVAAVAIFFARLPWSNLSLPAQALVAYGLLGIITFAYHVLVVGEIGRLGYHARFLMSLAAWPLLFWFHNAEAGRLERR